MVRWWSTPVVDAANATDWQDWDRTAVSYFSRSRNDTNKKQMTNTSSKSGWSAYNYSDFSRPWCGKSYDYSGARGSSDSFWHVVNEITVKPRPNPNQDTTDDSSAGSSPATRRSLPTLRTELENWESQEEIRIAVQASRDSSTDRHSTGRSKRSWADEASSASTGS